MTVSTTSTARPASVGAVEVCRLTVKTPQRRFDLALPVSAGIGELLPLVIAGALPEDGAAAWVIQRLGDGPLDPGATPESLGMHDGEVLYINRADQLLPEADFDDVTVGVAQVVAARRDQWRPEFSRYLTLAAALIGLAGFTVAVDSSQPHWLVPLWWAVATAALTAWGCVVGRILKDHIGGLIVGMSACVLGALAGLAAHHGAAGLFTLDRGAVLLVGIGTAVPAVILAAAGRLPAIMFGTLAALGASAVVGGALALGLDWDAVRITSLLAVVVFATSATDLRIVLRAARLRVPLLPRTAQELQEGIDSEPQELVKQRTDRAVSYLNILFLTASGLTIAAGFLLARWPGWIGWTLASVLGTAVLLRARTLTIAWQRAPLALSGMACGAFVVVSRISGAGASSRALVLFALLVIAAALFAASRLMPGRRMLPVWGRIAELLETWTAIALVPLLLQLLHVYAYFRSLIH